MALSAIFDISLAELSNENQNQNQNQNQNIIDNIFDLTIVQDIRGIIKSVHGRGFGPSFKFWDDVVGKNFVDILPVNISKRVAKAIEKLMKGDRLADFGYQDVGPDGKRYFSVKMVKADEFTFLSVITEVSKFKTEEHILIKNEALLTLVADTLKTGAWEVDLMTMGIVWTKQVFEIYELDEAPPTVAEAIRFYAPQAQEKVKQAFNNLIKSGLPYDFEVPFITAKGRNLWVWVIGVPRYSSGQMITVSGTIQDVTDLKTNESVKLT
jgi:PAS domain S-box-containing protein